MYEEKVISRDSGACTVFHQYAPQTIFAGEFTSGNLEEVTEETPEIFSDDNQEVIEETEEELSVFSSENVPEFSSEVNIMSATADETEPTSTSMLLMI